MSTILVVDDSELLHRMYDLMLVGFKVKGARVEHCMNGQEALDFLKKDPNVELILLDVQMPVMDGLTFLSERGEQPELSEIPVIMVSTKGLESETQVAMERGADAYLTKPFKPSDLKTLIEDVAPAVGKRAAQ